MNIQQTITMEEFETNSKEILNDVLQSGRKKIITIDGNAAIEILQTQGMINLQKKLEELQEENEALKFVLGAKRGLEDYIDGKLIDHNVVKDQFKKYLKT